VVALVAQLGSTRYADREAATQALDALGPAALEPLRKALQSRDAEVRRRAGQLVQQIDRRVQTARILEPTRVRLAYRDTPVTEAVADFARQAGFLVRLEGDRTLLAGRRITLDTNGLTLWEALDQLCQKAGLVERGASPVVIPDDRYANDPKERRILALEDFPGDGPARQESQLVLKDGAPPSLPTHRAGALRVRVLPPDTPLVGQAKAEGETLFGLEVRLEPRLQLQSVLAWRVDRAVDDQGQPLTPPTAVAGAGSFPGGPVVEVLILWDGLTELPASFPTGAGQLPVRLRLPERPSRRLKELHGMVAVRVLTAPEPLVTVEHIFKAAGQTVPGGDGSSLKLIEVRREGEGQVKLRVEVAPPPRDLILGGVPARILLANRWGRGGPGLPVPPAVAAEQLSLRDAHDRKAPLVSSTAATATGNGKAWEFTLVYRPDPGQGEPARLVYTGRRTATIEVPFTLKDVPLP
jgi:hypothetical protein